MTVRQPFADSINYGKIFTTIACHSAGISGSKLVTGRQLVQQQENNVFNLYAAKLYREEGRAVLTSPDVNEISQEGVNWGGGHGVFTWSLLEGMRGAGDLNKIRWLPQESCSTT